MSVSGAASIVRCIATLGELARASRVESGVDHPQHRRPGCAERRAGMIRLISRKNILSHVTLAVGFSCDYQSIPGGMRWAANQ